jgi:Peptidase family M28
MLGACSGDGAVAPPSEGTGPPEVSLDVVRRHARQFTEDVPERGAGSQEELAAATYITGHLQQAGYVVLLDAVPVRNLVRSTNVVARPPTGAEPKIVLATPYGSSPGAPDTPTTVGVFLELARALRAREPEHAVEFVALGAEFVDLAGGRLGSRRLAQRLIDEDQDPIVVVLEDVSFGDSGLTARGSAGADLMSLAEQEGIDVPPGPLKTMPDDSVWTRAGFDLAVVSGSASDVASTLLDYLTSTGR